MRALSQAAAPAVRLLRGSTEFVLGALGLAGSRETTVIEEEVKSLIVEGTRAGIFVPQEQEMIQGVLRLTDRLVCLIMSPRTRIAWIDVRAGRDEILSAVGSKRYSRLLVCEGDVDKPLGYVHSKDILPGGGEFAFSVAS